MPDYSIPQEFEDGQMGLPDPRDQTDRLPYTTQRVGLGDNTITVGIRVNGVDYDNISDVEIDDIWTDSNDDVTFYISEISSTDPTTAITGGTRWEGGTASIRYVHWQLRASANYENGGSVSRGVSEDEFITALTGLSTTGLSSSPFSYSDEHLYDWAATHYNYHNTWWQRYSSYPGLTTVGSSDKITEKLISTNYLPSDSVFDDYRLNGLKLTDADALKYHYTMYFNERRATFTSSRDEDGYWLEYQPRTLWFGQSGIGIGDSILPNAGFPIQNVQIYVPTYQQYEWTSGQIGVAFSGGKQLCRSTFPPSGFTLSDEDRLYYDGTQYVDVGDIAGSWPTWARPQWTDGSNNYSGYNNYKIVLQIYKYFPQFGGGYIYSHIVNFDIPTAITQNQVPVSTINFENLKIYHKNVESAGYSLPSNGGDPDEYAEIVQDGALAFYNTGHSFSVADKYDYWAVVDDIEYQPSWRILWDWLFPDQRVEVVNGRFEIVDQQVNLSNVNCFLYDEQGNSRSDNTEYDNPPGRRFLQEHVQKYSTNMTAMSSTDMTSDQISKITISGYCEKTDTLTTNSGECSSDYYILHTKIYDADLKLSNDNGESYYDRVVLPPGYNEVYFKYEFDKVDSNDPATILISIDYGDGEIDHVEWTNDSSAYTFNHMYYGENVVYYPSVTAITKEQQDHDEYHNPGYPEEWFYDSAKIVLTQRLFLDYPGLCYNYRFNTTATKDGNPYNDYIGNSNYLSGLTYFSNDDCIANDGMFGSCYSGRGIVDSGFNVRYPIYAFENLSQSAFTSPAYTAGINASDLNNLDEVSRLPVWTLSCWVNMNSGSDEQENVILSRTSPSTDDYLFSTSGKSISKGTGYNGQTSNTAIMTGTWHNVVWQVCGEDSASDYVGGTVNTDKHSVSIFVDGEPYNTSDTTFTGVNIFHDPDNPNRPVIGENFDGRLSDLKIFNRKLSKREIEDIAMARCFEMKFDSAEDMTDGQNLSTDNSFEKLMPTSTVGRFSVYSSNNCDWYSGNSAYGTGYITPYQSTSSFVIRDEDRVLSTTGNGLFTIEVFANIDSSSPFVSEGQVINLYRGSGTDLAIRMPSGSDYSPIIYWDDATGTERTITGDTGYFTGDGDWHLYTITIDHQNEDGDFEAKFYKDGEYSHSETSTYSGIQFSTEPGANLTRIGGNQNPVKHSFTGSVGYVSVYKTKMTPSAISTRYNRLMCIDEFGSVESLEFDETIQSSVSVDLSGRTLLTDEIDEVGPTDGLYCYYKFDNNNLDYSFSGNNWINNPDGFMRYYSYGGIGKNYSQSLTIWDDVSGSTTPYSSWTRFAGEAVSAQTAFTAFFTFRDMILWADGSNGTGTQERSFDLMSYGLDSTPVLDLITIKANYTQSETSSDSHSIELVLTGHSTYGFLSQQDTYTISGNYISGLHSLSMSFLTEDKVSVKLDGTEILSASCNSSESTTEGALGEQYSYIYIFNNAHHNYTPYNENLLSISTDVGEFRQYNELMSDEDLKKLHNVSVDMASMYTGGTIFTSDNVREV